MKSSAYSRWVGGMWVVVRLLTIVVNFRSNIANDTSRCACVFTHRNANAVEVWARRAKILHTHTLFYIPIYLYIYVRVKNRLRKTTRRWQTLSTSKSSSPPASAFPSSRANVVLDLWQIFMSLELNLNSNIHCPPQIVMSTSCRVSRTVSHEIILNIITTTTKKFAYNWCYTNYRALVMHQNCRFYYITVFFSKNILKCVVKCISFL